MKIKERLKIHLNDPTPSTLFLGGGVNQNFKLHIYI
jgi:hypothetical protein